MVPQEAARNGKEALAISERLCQMTHRQQPVFLRTLAAAHAELGNFDQAVTPGDEALRLTATAQERSLREQIANQLSSYRAGQPYRLSLAR